MPAATSGSSVAGAAPARANRSTAVVVDGLSKTFKLPHQHASTLKERVLHPFSTRSYEALEALKDVSFEVEEGEFFGIVGRNGSGKSTLLKCLAGIYSPTAGAVDVQGRIATFIELGVGFNPELTARDNVLINATMLGLSRRKAADAFDEIVAFAELEAFVDLKLKNYSSGMNVRLAFATAVQVDADVLIVDEVLAVGDAAFQVKCQDEFRRMKGEGRTILFVTHDMAAVERFCDRAMLLDHGTMVDLGDPVAIGRQYNEYNFGRGELSRPGEARFGSLEAEIVAFGVEQPTGVPAVAVNSGEPAVLALEIWTREAVEEPVVSFAIRNEDGIVVFAPTSEFSGGLPARLEAGRRYRLALEFDCLLAPGRYEVTPGLARAGHETDIIDMREAFGHLVIHSVKPLGAICDLPHSFRLDPA
jgi:ABC-type polysaccharide/polyol phosphate transport system ATPase subunit